jgi:hypothetical protein
MITHKIFLHENIVTPGEKATLGAREACGRARATVHSPAL